MKAAAVFADGLATTVDNGMGSITNIFGSQHYLNSKCRGLLRDASSRTRGNYHR